MCNPIIIFIFVYNLETMKGFITLLLTFLVTVSTAQNISLMKYINDYRVSNGKTSVAVTSNMNKISVKQILKIVKEDSLSHSGTNTYECVTRSANIAPTPEKKAEFEIFLKKNFDIDYDDPEDSTFDVEKFAALYVVFLFSKSPKHNAIMLSDNVKEGGAVLYLGNNITFNSNKRVIGGKTYTFSKIVSHVEVNFFGVLNLK